MIKIGYTNSPAVQTYKSYFNLDLLSNEDTALQEINVFIGVYGCLLDVLRGFCIMVRFRLFPLLLLFSSFCSARPACSPAEEGEQITLSCTVNTAKTCNTDMKMEWFVDNYTNRRILGCSNAGCGGFFRDIFSSTDFGSTLTISKVSRTVPTQFSMETRWTCRFCNGPEVTACNMLDIYAKPENPSCTVRENTAVPGDIESVTVSCSTTKVYPGAKCSFERRANSFDAGDKVTNTVLTKKNHLHLALIDKQCALVHVVMEDVVHMNPVISRLGYQHILRNLFT
ncbi:hypothetical protein PoB_006282900 [Plakobranchus ocellatus]|uniref:Ig-like domain-containing protein n=1 Tax=Plakobranchus ocellatus TaxID=259542 RepID=A0AAV4CWQ6_9GAST|nr:hypothetical protein PoB_006282900 [Plakobranchus ocellatus]